MIYFKFKFWSTKKIKSTCVANFQERCPSLQQRVVSGIPSCAEKVEHLHFLLFIWNEKNQDDSCCFTKGTLECHPGAEKASQEKARRRILGVKIQFPIPHCLNSLIDTILIKITITQSPTTCQGGNVWRMGGGRKFLQRKASNSKGDPYLIFATCTCRDVFVNIFDRCKKFHIERKKAL